MLLLIFFLLTSQFVIQTGVKVRLPGAENNEQTSPSRLIISITEDNRFYFGNTEIGMDEIGIRLSQAAASENEKALIIRADKSVKIDIVIKIIDTAKGLGIDKFTIETEKVE